MENKPSNGKTILIVEDELALLELLSEEFKQEGFNVLSAKDGEEGLKFALESKPDYILLDIVMPKMDGLTMLEHLRADPRGSNIPVTMLTNLSDIEATAKAVEHGVRDYLVKSNLDIRELVNQVKSRLHI